MKHPFCFLILIYCLSGCNSPTGKNGSKNNADTLRTDTGHKQQQTILIKDKSNYDASFINGLNGYDEPIQLIDNYIVVNEKDTTYFPEILPLNEAIIFEGSGNHNRIQLTVTRTNLTTLVYDFKNTGNDNKIIDSRSGKAVIGSLFFFAPEADIDTIMNEGYACSEYWDTTRNCSFSVRIGLEPDKNGKQRAKITYGCTDNPGIDLDECPILRTRQEPSF